MQDDLDGGAWTPVVNFETANTAEQNGATPMATGRTGLLAPAWHTVLVVMLVAATSFAGARSAKHLLPAGEPNHLPTYLSSIALEWVLAGIVLWGLRLRRTTLRTVLGESRQGIGEWMVDAGVAFVFWIAALTVLLVLSLLLKPMHLHTEGLRDTVSKLAPSTPLEMLAWAILCVSAGVCEEFVFRGYLQQQFARMSHRVGVGVIASAIVFGFAHGYEGLSGMVLIVAFGALFSVLRLIRGNVRAGMIAHAWHDFFSGVVLYAVAHHGLPR